MFIAILMIMFLLVGVCAYIGTQCEKSGTRTPMSSPTTQHSSRISCQRNSNRDVFPVRKRFVAIDFETANDKYYSACSLGIVLFENLQPVERKGFLIKPPTKFDPVNIEIHGITPEMVADAPSFDMIWEQVLPYLTGTKVVMYSDFDAKVLKSLIRHFKLEEKVGAQTTLDCFDVCECSRNTIRGLTNYKLPTVCKFLGIEGLNHHAASSDAEACGKIYAWLVRNNGREIRAGNDRPATYAQQDYIRNLGGEVPPVLSVADASRLIDSLIEGNAKKREEEAEQRRLELEEEKRVQQAEKEVQKVFDRRKKEEDSLKLLAYEMSSPDYKARKSRSKCVQDLKEFQAMVNRVIEDKVIEVDEMLEIKTWLAEHKVLDEDFSEMFKLIDSAIMDGTIDEDETQRLYEGMLDCITVLRKRQSKIG